MILILKTGELKKNKFLSSSKINFFIFFISYTICDGDLGS
mgnify:CR=1 FL=1